MKTVEARGRKVTGDRETKSGAGLVGVSSWVFLNFIIDREMKYSINMYFILKHNFNSTQVYMNKNQQLNDKAYDRTQQKMEPKNESSGGLLNEVNWLFYSAYKWNNFRGFCRQFSLFLVNIILFPGCNFRIITQAILHRLLFLIY